MITKILEYAAGKAGIKKIGVLAENDKISMLPASGRVITRYRNGGKISELSAQIQAKGKDQEEIINILSFALNALTGLRGTAGDCDILSVREGQLPAPVTADDKGNYFYSCGIVIRYYEPPEQQEESNI